MNLKSATAALNTHLKPIGFRRREETWNRRVESVIEVVNLQVNNSGDNITINAGVLDPAVHRLIWSEEPAAFIEEPFCTVRVRVGELLDKNDRWWKLDRNETVGEIVSVVTEVVLPFLQQMHDQEAMVSWLDSIDVEKRRQPAEILGLAILRNLVGRHSEACALVAAQRSRAIGAWRKRYDEVAQRLGCNADLSGLP